MIGMDLAGSNLDLEKKSLGCHPLERAVQTQYLDDSLFI